MSTLAGFNANEVDTSILGGDFQPWPEGQYQVQLESAEMRDSKSGGKYIKCKYICTDGAVAYPLFTNITYEHSNPKAQNIGRAQLAELCHAVNVPKPAEPFELCNITHIIAVGHRKSEYQGEERIENVVRKWLPISEQTAAAAKQSATDGKKPAWAKK